MRIGRSCKLSPAELDAQQRALYDAIVGGARSRQAGSVPLADDEGCLEGPFNTFLLQPSLGQALQAVGATLRYESRLADRSREIAILVVAARKGADFERYAHEPVARSLGLTDEQLSGIAVGHYGLLDADEAAIALAAREMVDHEDLSDATFTGLAALIGRAQVFELTAVVGYYALLALQLRIFQVPSPGKPG